MIGVVLAGGASSRFGGRPKGLAPLKGRAMALCVADVLAAHCDRVLIEAPRDAGYEALELPVIHAAPEHAGKGPLAAIVAGLQAAALGEQVAFAPCDMPLLTTAIYSRLAKVPRPGAYARTAAGVEPLVAVLTANLAAPLRAALHGETLPRTHRLLDNAGAQPLDFPDSAPFANVNTSDDLVRVEAILVTSSAESSR